MLPNTHSDESDRGDRLFDSDHAKANIWLATDFDELQRKDGDRFDADEFTDLPTAIDNAKKWSALHGEPFYVWHSPHTSPEGRFPFAVAIQERVYLTPGVLVQMEKDHQSGPTVSPTNGLRSAMPWVLTDNGETAMEPGLTKREWFFGMALQGLLANPELVNGRPTEIPEAAAQYADLSVTALRGETGQPPTPKSGYMHPVEGWVSSNWPD